MNFSEDGTSVTYHCADKYKLVGSPSAVCESNGTWSSSPPKCIGMCVDCSIRVTCSMTLGPAFNLVHTCMPSTDEILHQIM